MLDTVIRNGTILDGGGRAGYLADVGIADGRIVAVGRIDDPALDVIDAAGCIVTPGFIDPHTHYDGQAIWSASMAPSSLHGVTTVVAGNCGVGFAPCHPADRHALVAAMEGVEDIPGVVMAEGLDWTWETLPAFLDAVASRPRDIDIGIFVPHSPLRLYVMGDRALRLEPSSEADRSAMAALAAEGIRAGALGFSTSRLGSHRDSSGNFIPSYNAAGDELVAIMTGARQAGPALFQMVPEVHHDSEASADAELAMIARVARETDCVATFTLVQNSIAPGRWRNVLQFVDTVNAGLPGALRPQVFPRPVGMLYGLSASAHPFVLCPSFAELEALPLAEKVERMRDPRIRDNLLSETPNQSVPLARFSRMWDRIYPFDGRNYAPAAAQSIAAQAASSGLRPEAVAYDLLLADAGQALLIATIANYEDRNLRAVHEMLLNGSSVVGLGDGGAHYGMICDASYPTFLLTYWARDRDGPRLPLPRAVQMLTSEPAGLLGLGDRGRIAPGYRADINVIDHDRLAMQRPQIVHDLPAGGRRFMQGAVGYRITMVAGEIIMRSGASTGALPGQLVRGARPAPVHQ